MGKRKRRAVEQGSLERSAGQSPGAAEGGTGFARSRSESDPPARRGRRDKRRAKLEQFVPTVDGEFAYTGGYHIFQGGEKAHRRAMTIRWALSLGAMGLLIAAGCLPTPAMYGSFYVILPYTLALIAAVGVVWPTARMAHWGYPLRAYVYEATVVRIPRRSMTAAVLSILAGVGEGVQLALSQPAGTALVLGISFLMLTLGAAVCALALWRMERGWRWSLKA